WRGAMDRGQQPLLPPARARRVVAAGRRGDALARGRPRWCGRTPSLNMDLPTTMPDSVAADLPTQIDSEDVLDELLTRPGEALIDSVRTIASPLLILGAGGKMGPTLAVL